MTAVAFHNRQDPDISGAITHPLGAKDNGMAVAFQQSQSGMRVGDTHATLDSHNGSRRHHGVMEGMQVRRLTPRECERLQGFPDDYTLIPYRGKLAADGPRYKALGNSMAVPVMRWIGTRIALVESIVRKVCSYCRQRRKRAVDRAARRTQKYREGGADLPAWQIEAVIEQMAVWQRWQRNQA